MKFAKIKSLFIIIVLTFIAIMCSNPVTPPPPPQKPDSTSHEIIWEVDTLGDWNSDLSAVWGSSPDNVWATGWITRGSWGTNIIHYDGEKWEDYDYFEADLNGMFGLNENDIWAVGNNLIIPNRDALIAHYDGTEWKTVHIDYGTSILKAVWASAPDDVFAVGFDGTILHYNGKKWDKMKSGTDKHLFDVWGFASDDVYACGGMTSTLGYPFQPTLIHYDGLEWKTILDTTGYEWHEISTIWGSSSDNVYYDASFGLFQGNLTNGWNYVPIPDDNTAINKIRGSASFNIFEVGHFGLVLHYNGRTWRRYNELLNKPGGPLLSDVIVFENSVFIVGLEHNVNKAIVYRGTIKN